MILLRSRSAFDEHVTDGIKQSNVAARAENFSNLNLISFLTLRIRVSAVARL